MSIETKFDSPGQERKSEAVRAAWQPGGASRAGHENAIAKNVQLFKYGLSIEEIREQLGYARNSVVASYLRQGGINIPRPEKNWLNKIPAEEFYKNIKIKDL